MWRKDSKNWAYTPTSARSETPPPIESTSDSEDGDRIRTSKRKNKGYKRADMFWSPPSKRQRKESSRQPSGEQEEKENVVRPKSTPKSKAPSGLVKANKSSPLEAKSPLLQRIQSAVPYQTKSGKDNTDLNAQHTPQSIKKSATLKKTTNLHSTEPVTNLNISRETLKLPQPVSLKIKVTEREVEAIKQSVSLTLTGKRHKKTVGLTEETAKVQKLLEQTVVAGEGNSMLLIGARGSGKSAVVDNIISELRREHNESFHVVKLNGFVHTDDKLALRDIWRQLGREMELEEDTATRNYADTLSTLLALLSHPSDTDGEISDFAAKSVIFVLDEFDQFTTHPRQTLLYNLFDIAQARKAPIAVLGLTTRIDVAENLEKRVKSRFTHRYVHFGLPQSFSAMQHICQQALSIDYDDAGDQVLETVRQEYIDAWNASIEILFQSPLVVDTLSRVYYSSKSIFAELMVFLLPIASLSSTKPLLTPSDIAENVSLARPDSRLDIVAGLPVLALTMLIAAARLEIILDNNNCNFHMAYEEYSNIASRARVNNAATGNANTGLGGRVWGRAPAKAAWERLIYTGLLLPVVGGTSATNGNDMCRCDVALTEIEGAVPDLDKSLTKWVRSI